MVIVMNKKVKIWGDPCQLQSMSIATCIALSAKNNTALFGEMIVTNVNEDTILFFTICWVMILNYYQVTQSYDYDTLMSNSIELRTCKVTECNIIIIGYTFGDWFTATLPIIWFSCWSQCRTWCEWSGNGIIYDLWRIPVAIRSGGLVGPAFFYSQSIAIRK